ncbi:Wzz/FepE/Etk N-terminal domain-containing protein [Paenibacillus sediminis]|uniref:Capsular polysaccharide biosynthesis protein n=1 Tax=Paenibacillus sediminis TaxID=664909 RepID=A0ABS4H4I5_9BACL|nr:capsular polysaccharide biosynthesis protein [Paenibacillus sediminis]
MELKEFIRVIREKLWFIIGLIIVVSASVGIQSYYFTQPMYQASAKLIVNQSVQLGGVNVLDFSSLQTDITVINSYIEIIESSAIMDKVAAQYTELGVSSKQLSNMITVNSANRSQVMELVIYDTSYKRAAEIVNAVAHVFKNEIPSIMKVDNVSILSEAKPDERALPINLNPVIKIIIAGIVSAMMAVGLVFLMDYLDDTMKSEVEVEREIGLPTLTVIAKIKNHDVRTPKTSASALQQVGEGKYATINQ